MIEPFAGPGAVVVGVADLAVGHAVDRTLATYGLGSCIALSAYDPIAQVGGLLHFMLPAPAQQPHLEPLGPEEYRLCMYATTGFPLLLRRLQDRGADLARVVVCAVGGAETICQPVSRGLDRQPGSTVVLARPSLGARNQGIVRELLERTDMTLAAQDCGGTLARSLLLDLRTGTVVVRSTQGSVTLWQDTDVSVA